MREEVAVPEGLGGGGGPCSCGVAVETVECYYAFGEAVSREYTKRGEKREWEGWKGRGENELEC